MAGNLLILALLALLIFGGLMLAAEVGTLIHDAWEKWHQRRRWTSIYARWAAGRKGQ